MGNDGGVSVSVPCTFGVSVGGGGWTKDEIPQVEWWNGRLLVGRAASLSTPTHLEAPFLSCQCARLSRYSATVQGRTTKNAL